MNCMPDEPEFDGPSGIYQAKTFTGIAYHYNDGNCPAGCPINDRIAHRHPSRGVVYPIELAPDESALGRMKWEGTITSVTDKWSLQVTEIVIELDNGVWALASGPTSIRGKKCTLAIDSKERP